MLVYFVGYNLAIPDVNNSLRVLRDLWLVGNKYYGTSLFGMEPLESIKNYFAGFGIKIAGWFIRKN